MNKINLYWGATVLAVILIFAPLRTNAKAFGSDCEEITTGGGSSCYVTRTVCRKYFLWIRYDTEIREVSIDCSHLL